MDDTFYYIHRYLEELEGAPSEEVIERSNGSVGYALLYTLLIITLGFSLLAYSEFIPSVLFGLLTGFALAAAFVFDLTLLQVLLHRFVRCR